MSTSGALSAMLNKGGEDCATAISTGKSSDFKKCLNYDFPSTLHHDTDFYRDDKPRKSRMYRMGDNSIPIEVVVQRPPMGGPSPHISVIGDANIGEVKDAPSDEQIHMDEMGRTVAYEPNPDYD